MDNVIFVTIVYARQNLLHENCSIFLSEFSSCNDFIKQFTTFANSNESKFDLMSLTQSQCNNAFHLRRTHTFSQYLDDPIKSC